MLKSEKTTEFNYGLALLRMLMCFEVVLCHCWMEKDFPKILLPFDILRNNAVPVFMFMSFYLSRKYFLKKNIKSAARRAYVLFVPQVFWAIIYFVIYFLIELIVNHRYIVKIQDLFWQIFTGHSPNLNATMWFQTDLLIISVLFFVVFYFLSEKQGVFTIILLSVICLFLQYSRMNYELFGQLRYELKFPLGRLAETFPIATFGFISSKYNLLSLLKKRWINISIATVLFVLSFVLSHQKHLLIIDNDFGYSGIWKIITGYAITMFAYNCNFSLSEKKSKFIAFISQNTLGVYCSHRLIAFFLFNVFQIIDIQTGKFYQCVLVYLIGFVVFTIIKKFVPYKWINYII